MDSYSEPELISLVTQLMDDPTDWEWETKVIPMIIQIVSVIRSMDLDLQPKPESKFMSLVTQTISLFNSMDLDSQPKPLSNLISFFSNPDKFKDSESEFKSLMDQTLELKPEPELMSLIQQIIFVSMNSKWKKLISLSPQVEVYLKQRKFHVLDQVHSRSINNNKWECLPIIWEKLKLKGEDDVMHFRCPSCNGENHKDYEEAPVEIKHHHLHPKHSLQLVSLILFSGTRKCYCCDEDLVMVFYYCSVCDFAMNIVCVEKPPILSADHRKWHEHTLALFPRRASLTCNLCALDDASSPIYMCPPCDFVVHVRCLKLPRVIRISRHLHRITFTSSFDQGDWSCSVCRKNIETDYGFYSCTKGGCLYAAHSRCATQSNVWDGIELEGEPEEENEEEVEPYVKISDGIIQHFSHQHHHLRLTSRNYYDENNLCQACITPIYFGDLYSCMQCDYILHQACANLSRKIQHPIHPHLLTLALMERRDITSVGNISTCKACLLHYTAGFFYECSKGEECDFKLHVQCATISEPLLHGSHIHPLFLTSKPGEERQCSVCKRNHKDTFNCIDCEGDFALCYKCATIPEKLRYKHDKHVLTLSYGDDTSTVMNWCEVCEGKIDPKERFYTCDEYCCVTLHKECLVGKDLYMKPGSSWNYLDGKTDVLPNNQHMTRPICFSCNKRCPREVAFQYSGSIVCSLRCLFHLKWGVFIRD